MTKLQYLSHAEQMQAERRDFQAWFNRAVLPTITAKEIQKQMDQCWKCWLAPPPEVRAALRARQSAGGKGRA